VTVKTAGIGENRGGHAGEPPAFVLAIDHRNSLRHWYLAITGADAVDPVALSAAKVMVADGLLAAIQDERFSGQPMLLIDEEYGADAIRTVHDAATGVQVIVPAERSGQPEFSFEHGADFGTHIAKTGSDIVKALVRYNPAGPPERNARSRTGLTELARWLDDHGVPLMLELLVPAEPGQLEGGGQAAFDADLRPGLTLRAIGELREAGLSPAYWKVEGQPSADAFGALAGATGGGRCLVLGRGENAGAVGRWVAMAAAAEGFSGFAVGRTIWADPLADWLTGRVGRPEAVAAIASSYLRFTGIFLKNRRV
jgi:myo-inositol catabolism protein IolC